jgi:hypothetical protein
MVLIPMTRRHGVSRSQKTPDRCLFHDLERRSFQYVDHDKCDDCRMAHKKKQLVMGTKEHVTVPLRGIEPRSSRFNTLNESG